MESGQSITGTFKIGLTKIDEQTRLAVGARTVNVSSSSLYSAAGLS